MPLFLEKLYAAQQAQIITNAQANCVYQTAGEMQLKFSSEAAVRYLSPEENTESGAGNKVNR